MAVGDTIAALDYAFWRLRRGLGPTVEDYCDLETAENATTLVTKDGALCTAIRISGVASMVGAVEFDGIVSFLSDKLSSALAANGHRLHWTFGRDPSRRRSLELARELYAPSLATSQRLQLDLADVLEARAARLAEYCAAEDNCLVVWTMPTALAPAERKDAAQVRMKQAMNHPLGASAQRTVGALAPLAETHDAFCQALEAELGRLGLRVRQLSAHEAVGQARQWLYPDFTPPNWRPVLPGDPLPARMPVPGGERDPSCLLFPTLATQIHARDSEIVSPSVARIGRRLYHPVSILVPPAQAEPFNVLFQRLLDARIPYRIALQLEGDGLGGLGLREMLARLTGFTSRASRQVAASIDALRELSEEGATVVGWRCQATTWVDLADEEPTADERERLSKHVSRLARAMISWGGADVSECAGEPLRAAISTTPTLTPSLATTVAAAPVREAVKMLPATRPTSPWSQGSMIFRTPDGKPMPYAVFSSEQQAWVTLIYAPMGAGKSVLLNTLNTALCMAPGLERLPRIGIIDIGPSSAGGVAMIREALPAHLRHQAVAFRLRMTPDYAVNPFDTPLGCRKPLPVHRAFLVNFLSMLVTPPGDKAPYEGVGGVISLLVDMAYERLSDDAKPRRYTPRQDADVDQALAALGVGVDTRTTWWEVVDLLFEHGRTHEAQLAQRYAVPLIAECAGVAREEGVTSVYRGSTPGGEKLTDFVWRTLSEAVRMYPLFGQPTRFSVGDARVVSLDLDEVAPRGGAQAEHQTAVMYLLARHIVGSDVYLNRECLPEIPEAYRAHHAEQIEANATDKKRICFDEFHRTRAAQQVRDVVVRDIREGRKWSLEVVLASQNLEDFDEEIVTLSFTAFILGVGTLGLERTVKTFSLGPAAEYALERLSPPGPAGAPMIAWFRTATGTYVHQVVNTLPGIELWAYSTTREDAVLRDALYEICAPAEARKMLAEAFPGGSAKREIERRVVQAREQGRLAAGDDDGMRAIIKRMARDLFDRAHPAAERVAGRAA